MQAKDLPDGNLSSRPKTIALSTERQRYVAQTVVGTLESHVNWSSVSAVLKAWTKNKIMRAKPIEGREWLVCLTLCKGSTLTSQQFNG